MISLPGNIRLTISPFFWILALLIGWMNSQTFEGTLIWLPVIFFSVLIHELGHALTAKVFGQQSEIELLAYGGYTRRIGTPIKSWQEFLVILNGPLAGLTLSLAAFTLKFFTNTSRFPLLDAALEITVFVNIFWTFLNLIPVIPLDGGHLLRVLLEGGFGFKGTKLSFICSFVLAILLSLFFFAIQFFFAGAIFVMLAFENYRAYVELKNVIEEDTYPEGHKILEEAQIDVHHGQYEEAKKKLTELMAASPFGTVHDAAVVAYSQILASQGQLKEAFAMLYPMKDELQVNHLRQLQQWAYQLQKWKDAVEIGNIAYLAQPSGQVAQINALCFAIMGQESPAIGWLKCAREFNLGKWKDFLTKREFDVIRHSTEFQTLLKS